MGTLIKQEVNIWDKYNLDRDDLAKKLSISEPRTSALMLDLYIQGDPKCFKVFLKEVQVLQWLQQDGVRLAPVIHYRRDRCGCNVGKAQK